MPGPAMLQQQHTLRINRSQCSSKTAIPPFNRRRHPDRQLSSLHKALPEYIKYASRPAVQQQDTVTIVLNVLAKLPTPPQTQGGTHIKSAFTAAHFIFVSTHAGTEASRNAAARPAVKINCLRGSSKTVVSPFNTRGHPHKPCLHLQSSFLSTAEHFLEFLMSGLHRTGHGNVR